MTAIPFNSETGQVVGLDLKPASDGSGNYALVVSLDNPNIDVGTVDVALTYNLDPPVLSNGEMIGFQADINGNLKVALASSGPDVPIGSVIVSSLPELSPGSNTIGAVNQGAAGSSAWKVDPSGGGTLPAPTASSAFAITPGASASLEAGHVLKASAGNLYSLYVMTTSVAGFLMTFNATSIPANGAVNPVECIQIPAGSAAAISFDGAPPDYYSTGIVAVFSSTGPFTKTASATAFFKWRVE